MPGLRATLTPEERKRRYNEYRNAWRKANPHLRRAQERRYRVLHRETAREKNKRNWEKHGHKYRETARLKAADRRRTDPDGVRDQQMRCVYGISLAEYRAIKAQQNGVCACCGQPETTTLRGKVIDLAIDHDHATGRVRALLCVSCNLAIGQAKESPALLRAMALYLEAHQCRA